MDRVNFNLRTKSNKNCKGGVLFKKKKQYITKTKRTKTKIKINKRFSKMASKISYYKRKAKVPLRLVNSLTSGTGVFVAGVHQVFPVQ